jgi:hypothetical protein
MRDVALVLYTYELLFTGRYTPFWEDMGQFTSQNLDKETMSVRTLLHS